MIRFLVAQGGQTLSPRTARVHHEQSTDAAARLDDLTIAAGNRLELLKGDRTGRHRIRVNDQYRVTFRWENGHANQVRSKSII